MKGIHHVIVQNKRIKYDFELRRNLTVLRGNSATGKTALIDMIQEYINNGPDSSIDLVCDKPCYVLEGATWRGQLSEMKDSIVFIDEGNSFVVSDEFSEVIQATDNYYVIASRESLPNLPYSVEEIYGIRTSGRYGGLKQKYNEFYRIYGADIHEQAGEGLRPEVVITEDSNAGYQFFQALCRSQNIECLASGGKSSILQEAKKIDKGKQVLLIADGAAFGPEIDRVMKYIKTHNHIFLYVPESFEWLILSANPMKDPEIRMILDAPSEHIESREFFSWERFFTKQLIERTLGTYLQYSKTQINQAYLQGTVKESILKEMVNIRLAEDD